MTTTFAPEHIDLGYALAFTRLTDNLSRPLTGEEQAHRDDCLRMVEAQAREQERERRVFQAVRAASHPDPQVRRYNRLERRAEDATGTELEELNAELDRLADSIYCRKYDC